MIKCPRCGQLQTNERGNCPFCNLGVFRHSTEKHAVKPRDLILRRICAHGILLCLPCSKCERYEGKDCEDYEQSMLVELRTFLIGSGTKKSEAWTEAKKLLAAIKLTQDKPK